MSDYVRFLNRMSSAQQESLYLLLIFSSMATTTSVFLHTLKFKKYIGPRTSFYLYAASYLATFCGFAMSRDIFPRNCDLIILTGIGMALNFGPKWRQDAYQVFMICVLFSSRLGYGLPIGSGVEVGFGDITGWFTKMVFN